MPASTAVPCCPNRHALKPFVTPHDRFNCDLCGDDQPKGIDMRGCRICEHDVCGKCSPPVDVPLDVADADAEIVEVCPSGHPLEPFAMEDEFGECDLCGCDQPEDAPMRSCRICDFDVCQSCTANLAPRPRAAAVPPVPVVERSDDIRKPAIDGRSYRYVKLPNELRIVLVSDGEADKAAASLDVAVGHACDPPELPGLAHFLEHMLFLGTAKYPDEDDYTTFLAQNGGASNAYTAFENTNYHFEVLPAHLPGALDRFAQFFIAPLFTEGATGRELKAIESENAKNLQSDTWRLAQLTRWAASPEHPQHKFGTGNMETLRDLAARPVTLDLRPAPGGSSAAGGGAVRARLVASCRPPLAIRDALFAFHQRHYSANAMRLCVVGKQSLAELEQLVLPLFYPIPNINRPPPAWPGEPYASTMRRALVNVPVRQLRLLTVLWPMPPIRQLWRSKPHRYISHLLGHESEGSLLSLLKGRGWVDSLCAGESVSASDFAMFEVQMALSEEGDGKVDEILLELFAAVNMLRALPPARWVFEECSSLAEMGFRYKEQDEPMDAANSLATSLEHHPPADVLSAPYLHQEFDPAAIEAMLALLTPARVITLHSSRCVAAAAPYREPWYNTPFGTAHISDETLERWAAASAEGGMLRLPDPNPFIPTDFGLVCDSAPGGAEALPRLPTRLLDEAGVELWHKTDATFRRPKTNMWMALQLSQAYATPLKVVMTSLFTRQLSDELTEFSYHAEVAGLHYRVQSSNGGLTILFGGYSHKLPALLQRVVSKLAAPDLAAERFAIQRDNVRRGYANFFKEAPYQHAVYLASVLLEVRRHHILDYYREVVESGSLDLDEYRAFVTGELLASSRMLALCHGNASAEQAGEMVATARAAIGSKPLSCDERRECESMYRALVLPADSEVWVRQHPSTLPEDQRLLANADETNSAIEVFLQAGVDERPRTMLVEMLEQVLHKCAEQQLRTVEQLGYIVWCTSRFTYNTVGLRFIIQSAVASPTTLDERIEAFLETVPALLRDLSEVDFADYRQALVERKLEVDKKLRQETARYWHEMTPLQQYDFDRNERDAEAVRALTQPQLAAFWDATLSRASGVRRKASFQVFAPHLELPPPPDGVVCLDTIEAVQQFKKSLSAWPGVHEEGGGGDSLQS